MADKPEEVKKMKISEAVEILTAQIALMAENMNALVKSLSHSTQPAVVSSIPIQERKLDLPPESKPIVEERLSAPIPIEYRQLVNEILNPEFEVFLYPRSDSPSFEFVISVPKKYSNALPPHWEMYGNDLCTIVLGQGNYQK